MNNMDKLKQKYKQYWKDNSINSAIMGHKNYHFVFGDYTVSVIQEPYYKGDNDMEYAIIYKDDLIFLEAEGDAVARYKGFEEVDSVLHYYRIKDALDWYKGNKGWIDQIEMPQEYQDLFEELLIKEIEHEQISKSI